jgi:hypothetical protein
MPVLGSLRRIGRPGTFSGLPMFNAPKGCGISESRTREAAAACGEQGGAVAAGHVLRVELHNFA